MGRIGAFGFAGTTFAASGAFDGEAFRGHLQRFVDADVGVYLASGGGGEGHALTPAELSEVYEIGVEVCGGKVPVHANVPEQHTAKAAIDQLRLAVDAGVDLVYVYQLAGWHGMKPTDVELTRYFDTVFDAIQATSSIVINPSMGYLPATGVIGDVCRRHPQVKAVRITGVTPGYLTELQEKMGRPIEYFVPTIGAPGWMAFGPSGIFGSDATALPKTFRAFVAALERGDLAEANKAYAALVRFDHFVRRWNPSNPRWFKMTMRVLRLPGGEGGVREPYGMPSAEELKKFEDGLLRLDIPELNEQARAAGLSPRNN